MSAITAKEQAVRNALDRGEALVAVDHDGVMAPIVANPLLARPLPAVNTAIAALASRTPVLLPSGRSVPFLRDRVPVPGVLYSGLYGRQWTTPDGRLASHPDAKKVRRSLAQARAESGRELRREGLLGNGVWIEDKEGLAFAVHFRPLIARIDQLRRLGPAADADRLYDLTVLLDTVTRRVPLILKQIGASHGLLVTSSNKVSEMSGPGFDKQRAVLEGHDRIIADGATISAVAYFGDEKRDLPAFDALDVLEQRGLDVLRVAVGGDDLLPELRDRADVVLRDPFAVAGYLTELGGLPTPGMHIGTSRPELQA
jgi:trehalose 6-phosphate phosphatase